MIDIALTNSRRYFSVALVLKSPSAGVTRYSCPVEPGLSSRTPFRAAPAAVQPACRLYSTRFKIICQLIGMSAAQFSTPLDTFNRIQHIGTRIKAVTARYDADTGMFAGLIKNMAELLQFLRSCVQDF